MKAIYKIYILVLFALSISACGSASKTETAEDQAEVQEEAAVEKAIVKNINAKAFQEMMADSNVVVIDVRTPSEIEAGYISGADMFIDYNAADFEQKIAELDQSKTYLMYCRSGGRSGNASKYMVENGFGTVYNLSGGIMNYKGEIITP